MSIYIDNLSEPVIKGGISLKKVLIKGDSFTGFINSAYNFYSLTEILSW